LISFGVVKTMDETFFSYLSLFCENEVEQEYIEGLIEQFNKASDGECYQLALFSYHLLFLCYIYQILYKIKIWMPDDYHIAMISFYEEKRKKFREAKSPIDFVHEDNKESSIFEFLNMLCDCKEVVSMCKNLVKFRNQRLGHINYLLVSKEVFEKQIEEYNKVVFNVHQLTNENLLKTFSEYLDDLDSEIEQTRDELEIKFISLNKISEKDLEFLVLKHSKNKDLNVKSILKIFKEEFSANV